MRTASSTARLHCGRWWADVAEFTAKAALQALMIKSNPVEWRQALTGLIDTLPDTLDHSDMSSTDVAGGLLQALAQESNHKPTTNYRSTE